MAPPNCSSEIQEDQTGMYNNHGRIMVTIAAIALSMQTAAGQVPANDQAGQEILAPGQVFGIVGSHVQDADGAAAGRLWDVLIDRNGNPRAVVIDYGGALCVGRRKVAIAWAAVRFTPDDDTHPVHLMLTRRELGTIPSFSYGSVTVTLGDGR